MRVAVLSEAEHDEILVRGLVDALLGSDTEPVTSPLRRRPGGWSDVIGQLPKQLEAFHSTTAADAIVVVVDSDDGPLTESESELTRRPHRASQIRFAVAGALTKRPRPHGAPALMFAVGLAVPTIESWALFGRVAGATEFGWRKHFGPGSAGRRKCKIACYGTDWPSTSVRVRVMKEAAERLRDQVDALERAFPVGFGMLADDVRGWRAGPGS